MTRGRILLAFAVVAAASGPAGWPRAQPAPWLINETDSVPTGLYRRSVGEPRIGALVVVAPPANARAYLDALGAAETARLLKRVAAGPGEEVCREGMMVSWPRGVVAARPADRRGRHLPAWAGCRSLGEGEFLVVGDTATSFDGRYFGPISRASIQGVYREVWRW